MNETARVCQFYLRGRCKREKCEFKHPQEFASRQQTFSLVKPRLKRKVRDLDSDQEIFDSSDDDDEDLKDRLKLREEKKVFLFHPISYFCMILNSGKDKDSVFWIKKS